MGWRDFPATGVLKGYRPASATRALLIGILFFILSQTRVGRCGDTIESKVDRMRIAEYIPVASRSEANDAGVARSKFRQLFLRGLLYYPRTVRVGLGKCAGQRIAHCEVAARLGI